LRTDKGEDDREENESVEGAKEADEEELSEE
jgi:hypothetical protein